MTLIAFATCWATLAWLLQRGRGLPMDLPNARSLHEAPTPRVGGLGVMAGVVVASMGLFDVVLLPFVLAACALAVMSMQDDVRGLPVVLRFSVHFGVAIACLWAIGLAGWGLLLGTLTVVWMTNLYNFMDGSDGLAGGMAAIGFGTLSLGAWVGEAMVLSAFCAAIAASALAFLRFNFPPGRLFMGDAGSIPLGFLAASLGIWGVQQHVWPWFFPLLVFSPFIIDASVTLLRRALRGEKVWQAHRSHYYQRVVLMGVSHFRLAVGAYALMAAGAASALFLLKAPQLTEWLFVLWGVIYASILMTIDWRWHRTCNEH